LAAIAAALTLAVLSATGPAVSQEKADNAEPAVEKPQPRKQPRARLPNFYRQVVSEQQREEIYKIQASYQAKIEALQAQLKAVVDERDAKVTAVLTPEQKKKVEELAAAAKAKRQQAQEKPAEPKVGG
jgi:Spy/CpxP family protein refolding chaperone